MAHYFLGVDGGKSSTVALIGDETGRVVGCGRSGPSNHVGEAEGRAKFEGAIGGCLREALGQASAADVRFEAACLGFSGGPVDKEPLLRRMLSTERLFVTSDALIALAGATAGKPGVITIAGTGSIAFGRNAAGETARAGGWGYVFGDEGSGFDLARQALRAALRVEEGWGRSTALRPLLLKETGARDANELLHWFYTAGYPRPRVAAYSKLVDRAAQNGDAVARDLLVNAAQQLAMLAAAVRSQLFPAGETVRVAYIGGVFRSELLLERFRRLVELDDGNRCAPPEYGPAAGALLEAYRLAGVHPKLSNLPEIEK